MDEPDPAAMKGCEEDAKMKTNISMQQKKKQLFYPPFSFKYLVLQYVKVRLYSGYIPVDKMLPMQVPRAASTSPGSFRRPRNLTKLLTLRLLCA